MLLLLIAAIATGSVVPVQTAANSQLRYRLNSPFMASIINSSLGVLFLILFSLALWQMPAISLDTFKHTPWWLWTGGVLGSFIICSAVLIMPVLGSLRTVLITMTGSILCGLGIDHFGFFNVPIHHFDISRAIGVLLVLVGLSIVLKLWIYLPFKKSNKSDETDVVPPIAAAAGSAVNDYAHNSTQASSAAALPVNTMNQALTAGNVAPTKKKKAKAKVLKVKNSDFCATSLVSGSTISAPADAAAQSSINEDPKALAAELRPKRYVNPRLKSKLRKAKPRNRPQHSRILRSNSTYSYKVGAANTMQEPLQVAVEKTQSYSTVRVLFTYVLALAAGSVITIQTAVNSMLTFEIHSAIHTALITMTETTIIFAIILIIRREKISKIKTLQIKKSAWIFCGGFCGATFIIGNSYLLPFLGASALIVLNIVGQLISSMVIDQFGLMGADKKKTSLIQIVGLVVIMIGVVALKKLAL